MDMQSVAKEPKNRRFVARVTEADRQLFEQAASIEGRSMATFVITHSREVARQVIQHSNQIHLDAAQSRRFVEALLAPPRPPTPALLAAIQAYRKTVRSDLD